jgi:hypothetical protein
MSSWAMRVNALASQGSGRELRRFLKFAAVGVAGFVVDFAVLNFLLFRLQMPPGLANACSFTLAVTNTFIWNRLGPSPRAGSGHWAGNWPSSSWSILSAWALTH